MRTPLRAGLRVFGAGILVSAAIAGAAFMVLTPLANGAARAGRVTQRDLSLGQQASAFRAALVRWQLYLEPRLDDYQSGGTQFSPTEIAKGSQITDEQARTAATLTSALRERGDLSKAAAITAAMRAFNKTLTGLSPIASGTAVAPAEFRRIARAERAAFATVWGLATHVSQDVTDNLTTPDVQYVQNRFKVARTLVVVLGGALAFLALVIGAWSARRAARRLRVEEAEASRREYGAALQQGLEMATTEAAVYGAVGRALRQAVPELDVELLIADSSRAHFGRVASTNPEPDRGDGCGVVSPRDCPAATRGHTMEFASSEAISSCPYLQDRPRGPLSAVCIPVSIAGSTVGVMHAMGTDGELPAPGDIENLELSVRSAAERVALLRAFERSEAQARTDPLTGLLNRRSVENQVRELQADGIPYVVAYGDLDHFKVLNDTHGHEAGDQALRLFSRVMRDAVRPADLVARYGGEEFVIVLPDIGVETATAVLERVRERLAITLTSGRVPGFTVSFGLATSNDGATFDEIVAAADGALLAAKTAGRNRVLVASGTPEG